MVRGQGSHQGREPSPEQGEREKAIQKGWSGGSSDLLGRAQSVLGFLEGGSLRERGGSVSLPPMPPLALRELALSPPNWGPCGGEAEAVFWTGKGWVCGGKRRIPSSLMCVECLHQGLSHVPCHDTPVS